MELLSRHALITGAGTGIGRTIALAFARQGASVALLGRTSSALEEVAQNIVQDGGQACICAADITRPETLEAAIAKAQQAWNGIDILVNNAGIQGPIGPTHSVAPVAWEETILTNLVGPFHCTRLVLPSMIERNYGKIINLSGGGAVSPRANFSAYGAAKAGLVRLTETLAAELASHRIDVNALAPGAVNTAMLDQILAAGQRAGPRAQAQARDQQRDGGTDPTRPAALAVFLASARSDGLSGRLFSAVWDSWEELDIARIMASEDYTVRRLTPPEEA